MKKRSIAYGLALGLTLCLCLGAYVTEKMFDTTYFSTSDTAVSLKGNLTNVFNGAGSAANWVASGSDSKLGATAYANSVVAGSYDVGAATVLTPIDAGTAINLSVTNKTFTCILTGNVTFAISNITPGRRAQLLIQGCSTNSTISFSSYRWGSYPTVAPLTNMTRINIEGWVINGVTNAFLTGVNGN